MEVVEESIQFTSERLNALATEVLPALSNHMARIAESLAHQTLQIDVHRRKWNVVIHGIDGPAGEEEGVTRSKCVNLLWRSSRLLMLNAWHLANAGIILRFTDLAQRDRWLTGTKNLRGHTKKISDSVDLPPILRPLKDSLMLMRSKLEPNIKSKSRVCHLPQWPFVELRIERQSPKRPQETLASISAKVLGFDHVFKVNKNS